jgi:hypothetical protein
VAVSGCGAISSAVNSATGDQAYKLLTSAKAAAKSAASVHMKGHFIQGGQAATIDVSFAGADLAGTVSEGGGALGIIETGGSVYLKVSAGFLKAQHYPASLCSVMCGKYIKASTSQAGSFLSTFRLANFMNTTFSGLPHSAAAFRGVSFRPASRGGQAAMCADSGGYSVCLTGHGTPYFLAISAKNGKEAITFSQWNKVPAIQAPPKGQTVSAGGL